MCCSRLGRLSTTIFSDTTFPTALTPLSVRAARAQCTCQTACQGSRVCMRLKPQGQH